MNNNEPTTAEKIRRLPWAIGASAANTMFVQFTFFGSVFVLFLNELGLDKSQIGFLLSLIPYTSAISLFIAPGVAKFGYKRTFLTFFGLRKIVTCFLFLVPWVLASFGPDQTLLFVSVIVLVFSLCRGIGETAYFPWLQEYVPSAVRGKFSANNNFAATLVGFVAVTVAGYVIERSIGLSGFMTLIGAGVFFGVIAVWCFSHLPGGAPQRADAIGHAMTYRDLLQPAQDKNFLRFIFGSGLITLAMVPIVGFLPLYMQEQVGLTAGNIVWLQMGTLVGGLVSTYFWGWAADRYSSRPVMLTGATLRLLLPLSWFLIPKQTEISLYVALGIALFQGVIDMGWGIGSTRLLFVNVVPTQQKTEYMALYSATIGLVGGSSQLLGGQILKFTQGLSGQWGFLTFDSYSILFSLGLILMIAALFLLRQVRDDNIVSVGEFVGLFLKGNPFLAMSSLIGYHLAKDEQTMVSRTERLAQTKSHLTTDELLEALQDPRFNVRFEAIVSIARMRPNPRLIEALIHILNGTELALAANAAWALGRLGDSRAVEALREGLDAPFQSIQVQSARALGTLGDTESVPLLLSRLDVADDRGLQMAYASALGRLKAKDALTAIQTTLYAIENEGARLELALALTRISGDENYFIQLIRHIRVDQGTALSQGVMALRKKGCQKPFRRSDLHKLARYLRRCFCER